MRTRLSLLVSLLVAGSFVAFGAADASVQSPVPSCVGVPCVSVAPPTSVGSDVQCHLFVNFAGDVVSCAVDGGQASVAEGLCQLCEGVTVLDCSVGTDANTCFAVSV